jgi:adenosylhomocysteine nucleosidase
VRTSNAPSTHIGLRAAAVIVGLLAEARLARRLGGLVYIGGGTAAGAAAASRRALADAAPALISLGLAGGLDPALRPGDVIVPEVVLASGHALRADSGLGHMLGGITPHRLLGAASVAANALSKQRLRDETGAAALDLESGAVATFATQQGVPFAVLRVICDPAERALPPAALVALNRRGAIDLFPVLVSVLAHPAQLPALLALTRDATTAKRALARRIASIAAGA